MGLNQFSALTLEEFKSQYTGLRRSGDEEEDPDCPSTCPVISVPIADKVNWTAAGAVTPVKNQGPCGSCWAFSGVQSLEGLHFLNTSKLIELSEQQLLDCDEEDFNCGGGWVHKGLEYTAKNGIHTEQDYPYLAKKDTCKHNLTTALRVNTGWQCVQPKSVEQFKAAVTMQPVAINLNTRDWIMTYEKGVVSLADCDPMADHAVIFTGYGPLEGYEGNVWYAKNSYTTKWGMEGYFYVSMDPTPNNGLGVCGILACGLIPINKP